MHIILRFWPVCHQFCYWMFTHGQMCAVWVQLLMFELFILCVCVFWMRTWLNLCKMMAFLCRVLQKALSKLERVCKQVKCVKCFENVFFFFENCKNGLKNWAKWISYSVLAIKKTVIYCRVQYNTANNNKNNYSGPVSHLWSGTGQRNPSTSQAILALNRKWG